MLTRNGVEVALAGASLFGSGQLYTLELSAVTGLAAHYQLRLNAAGSAITDTAGNLFAADAQDNWALDNSSPSVAVAAIAPNPRNAAEIRSLAGTSYSWLIDVSGPTAQFTSLPPTQTGQPASLVTLSFSEAVFGVSLNDFRVSRDGVPVALDNIPFSRINSDYSLDLSLVTQSPAAYELRLGQRSVRNP